MYRLFFKPLRNIIQKREDEIRERLKKIEDDENRIKELEEEYLEKLKETKNLREKELSEAKKEALSEKETLIKEAKEQIQKEFEKEISIVGQEREKIEKEIKHMSLKFSLYYAEKLLTDLADSELHQKLIDKFLQELKRDESEEIITLKRSLMGQECRVELYSPFKLQEKTYEEIKQNIKQIFECKTVLVESVQDASLICGIKLRIKNKILDASIRGEIERFVEKMQNER